MLRAMEDAKNQVRRGQESKQWSGPSHLGTADNSCFYSSFRPSRDIQPSVAQNTEFVHFSGLRGSTGLQMVNIMSVISAVKEY